MVLVGHESSDPPPAASQSHESLLEEEWPEPPAKEEFGGEGDLLSRPQSPEPERRHTRSMGPPTYQLPLVQNKPNAQKVYQPYSLGDIQALIDKLPDIQEGGNTWLSDFDTLTAGQDLALGDFRAVITRCTSRSQSEALEKDAGTTRDSNSVPLATPPPQQTLPDQVSPIAWQPQPPYSGQPQPQYSGPYRNSDGQGATADPLLSITVDGQHQPFLVETGATCSTIQTVPPSKTSTRTISVTGFSGEQQTLPFSLPLPTTVGNQTVLHSFVCSPTVPVNLLGRDLLIKLGATILCGPTGLTVTLPEGTILPCTGEVSDGMYLAQKLPDISDCAEIYWALLDTETKDTPGLMTLYQQWKPWLTQVHPYVSPPDPPHLTLFYDRHDSVWYKEAFQNHLEGQQWCVQTTDIYAAPEGVAAAANLTQEQ
ncbi:uncharacterized protein [Nothobranchius furzeri]|uniref:uncharacterized protein n=1 Tax=Nothobranchius furzeri TaxID=105023 RepID=UPI003904DA12